MNGGWNDGHGNGEEERGNENQIKEGACKKRGRGVSERGKTGRRREKMINQEDV